VGQFVLLDGEQEHRPRAQVERDAALVLEAAVPVDRFVEQLVDPGSGLAEEEAAVSSRGAGPDTAAVDDEDGLARLCQEARRRAAGDPGSDDDGVYRP
jgi:hypothetical protein